MLKSQRSMASLCCSVLHWHSYSSSSSFSSSASAGASLIIIIIDWLCVFDAHTLLPLLMLLLILAYRCRIVCVSCRCKKVRTLFFYFSFFCLYATQLIRHDWQWHRSTVLISLVYATENFSPRQRQRIQYQFLLLTTDRQTVADSVSSSMTLNMSEFSVCEYMNIENNSSVSWQHYCIIIFIPIIISTAATTF